MLPFRLWVYDKDYTSRGVIGAPLELSGEDCFNAPGSAEFTLPSDHPRAPDLNEPGSRVVIDYRTPDGWLTLLSGRVEEVGGGGGSMSSWRSYRVIDDFAVLTDEVQCWPKPDAAITAQSDAYHTVTGAAETVLKQILAPNVARQGTELTIPTSNDLGPTVTCSVRFHTVAERVLPYLDAAGLGVRVRQVADERVLQVWEPSTVPFTLTEASGVVVDGEYSVQAPTVTRVAVGAGGEGAARVFRMFADLALEAEWGITLPAFRDARDVAADDSNLETALEERAAETLTEGAPKASLRCELVETDHFRLGVAYNVGDVVTVQLAGAPPITDRVRSVEFSWTPDDGARITPRVGEWSDTSETAVVQRVVALTRAVSDLQKGW